MSAILSAQRLMSAGLAARVANVLLNLDGQGISLAIGSNELFTESSVDSITAYAAGGQSGATQLTSELNRITTAASAGASVLLPVSAAGLSISVENAGANPIQVFGSGTDTVNGTAAASGVSQMPNSVVLYFCYAAGSWFAANLGTGYAGSLETMSGVVGITAFAGGGQGNATALTAMYNQIATAAAGNASVVLPSLTLPNGAAASITVNNLGANTVAVFCPSGGTMNGSSNGSASLAANNVGLYFCSGTNNWYSK